MHSSKLSNRKIDLFLVRKQVGLASFYRRKLPIIYPLHCFSPTFSHSSADFLKNFNSVLSGKLKLNEVKDFTLLCSRMKLHFFWTQTVDDAQLMKKSLSFKNYLSLNWISRVSVWTNWINFVLALDGFFKRFSRLGKIFLFFPFWFLSAITADLFLWKFSYCRKWKVLY